MWEWDAAPYAESAVTDFIGNFQREMRFKGHSNPWPWTFKKRAILHAIDAITATLPPKWRESTFVPVPPSKIRTDPNHDPRLLTTLLHVKPAIDVRDLVLQITNTQSRAKGISPYERAENWEVVPPDPESADPQHFLVFDDLLTGASHFAGMKIALAREYPDVPVSGLFLARRLRPSQIADPAA